VATDWDIAFIKEKTMGRLPMNDKLLIAFLAAACAIPTLAGTYRVVEIILTGQWGFNWARDTVDRLPLFVHASCSILFLCLGAIQLVPSARRRNMKWHKTAGRVAVSAGLLGALSGVWMTLAHPDISTAVLYYARLGASLFWAVAIVLAVRHVVQGQRAQHRAWMIRAYAIALPAGTLAFIMLPIVMIFGEEGNALLLETVQAAAWPLHMAIAEWIIRRPAKHSRQDAVQFRQAEV
jgi:uncharacterized membrane protein YozB (DUF420 family)